MLYYLSFELRDFIMHHVKDVLMRAIAKENGIDELFDLHL